VRLTLLHLLLSLRCTPVAPLSRDCSPNLNGYTQTRVPAYVHQLPLPTLPKHCWRHPIACCYVDICHRTGESCLAVSIIILDLQAATALSVSAALVRLWAAGVPALACTSLEDFTDQATQYVANQYTPLRTFSPYSAANLTGTITATAAGCGVLSSPGATLTGAQSATLSTALGAILGMVNMAASAKVGTQ
jgi:hypothetical protein